jgi:hypothetical protein
VLAANLGVDLSAEPWLRRGVQAGEVPSLYPEDIPGAEFSRPLDDVRKVLWCLERINVARRDEDNLDKQLLVALIGWHAIWWHMLTRRMERKIGAILKPLDELTEWLYLPRDADGNFCGYKGANMIRTMISLRRRSAAKVVILRSATTSWSAVIGIANHVFAHSRT